MFNFRRKKPVEPEQEAVVKEQKPENARKPSDKIYRMPEWEQPKGVNFAQDHEMGYVPKDARYTAATKEHAFFFEQGFIGYAMCAYMARNWVIDKACNMPARDAIRNGWLVNVDDDVLLERLLKHDRKVGIKHTCREFVRMGRVYGGQLALFDIASENPTEFYENPFNIEGVRRGAYRGIVLIDPVDASPILTPDNVSDPANPRYLMPTYWQIGGRKYHHSHLMAFAPYPVPKLARHAYNYFGVSVPERIFHRVYSAEKTADEALSLAVTKRLVAMYVAGLDDADQDTINDNLAWLSEMRDNHGVLVTDSETQVTQLETNLTDFDTTIMTQYQLVAAAAGVHATKLIETTPKGFNATGEYEEASYRQVLESIQENDLTPLLERHYQIAARHFGADANPEVEWESLDSPTAKEYAEIEGINATTMATLANASIIDGYTAFDTLTKNKNSMFYGMKAEYEDDFDDEI